MRRPLDQPAAPFHVHPVVSRRGLAPRPPPPTCNPMSIQLQAENIAAVSRRSEALEHGAMVLFKDCSSPEEAILSTKVCRTFHGTHPLTLPALHAPTNLSSTRGTGNLSAEIHHIDELPEEILVHIFSFLEVKEVVHARLASRRWNQLCKSIRELHFNWFTMFETRPLQEYLKDYTCYCQHHQDRFIRGVNQNLQFNTSSDLWYLRIAFCFGIEHTLMLDMWVRFAVSMGIRKFFLILSCGRSPYTVGSYVLNPSLFSEGLEPKFTFLSLRSCILVDGLFEKLLSLKELILARVSVAKSDVKSILSCCLKLEKLWTYWCLLPKKLCITGPDLHLKVFNMHRCRDVQEIEVSATKLTHFYYCGGGLDVSFCEVPNLERMYIIPEDGGEEFLFRSSFRNFRPVKILSVYAATKWVYNVPSAVTSFRRLKQLTLFSPQVADLNMLKLTSILKACQTLEMLRIVTKGFQGPMTMPFEYVNKSLKKVELDGFYRIWEQIEFVRYLLECAVALEEIVLDPRMDVFNGFEWKFVGIYAWNKAEREKIHSLLKGFLRAAVLIVK